MTADAPGRYLYTVVAWVDHFVSWREDFARRVEPRRPALAALVGAELIQDAAGRARGADRGALKAWAGALLKEARRRRADDTSALQTLALDPHVR